MYLIDTNVISEARKGQRADTGVQLFFRETAAAETAVFVSAITVGELRRGVDLIRHRGDARQAAHLEHWLNGVVASYADTILSFDADCAQVWGRLRVPHADNALDKQIAATALIHDLTVVTRNSRHFERAGVALLNPFVG